MPRSSRHKSSKHSSRDARDYSDSEKDSSLKERKGKEESSSRASKDSDKRRLDSKDSGKGEHPEPYVSSKRRKERAVDDGVSDRWNGGEEDRGEVSRKSKSSSDSKSKRKEESEGKHKESSRKDRESGGEREKETKGKEGKSDRLLVSEEEGNTKQLREITESNTVDAEPDKQLEKRNRRRRDGSGDGDKHLDDVGDAKDKRFSSKDDISRDGKLKDEKHKDERYKDKYHEDSNWDNKHRDERPAKDHTSSRSDEKLLKDDKDMTENRHKKSKAQDHDRDHYHDHQSERDRDRDGNRNRDRDYYRDHDWDQDRDRERGRDREYNRDRDRETDRERERDYDHEDRSARYKDSRGRKRSPDDRDDYNDSKPRVARGHYSDMEKKPLSSSRAESEADRGRSQSRQVHVDSSSKRRRNSPYSGSHAGTDDYRYFKAEESKYSDSVAEQRSKAISSREVTDVPERSSKYRSTDKSNKVDDGHLGELSAERSSSSKASPMGLVERSPSSTSAERRQMNRSGIKRSLDVEEPGRRNVPLEKPLGEDTSQADSSYYNRTGQSNSSSIPPLSGYRAGADSPSYRGSLEDENRFNSNARYKRSGDPNMARGHGNSWRGVPSWSSPMPNGFMPFPHGPPLGGFQAMMPQFPSPPLFGVRPSMEMNHAGLPYHIPDADRFSGHLRPLGWQNMMDGSGPPHLHGWDGNNGVFRDETHMYGAPDWDQNRHPMNRGWENSSEMWKGQNDDVDRDSTSQKEDYPVHETEDGKTSQQKRNHIGVHAKDVETRLEHSPAIKTSQAQPEVVKEKALDISGKSRYDDVAQLSRAYLSKLDVSSDLACQELYVQCMRLLDLEDEEEATAVYLHGGRASLKTSLVLHSPSPLPTSKDTVFQRAMDLYKKQRVESRGVPFVSQPVLDEVVANDPKIRDDHISSHDEGKEEEEEEEEEEEQVLTSNVEPTDASSDQQIAEVVLIKEEPEELVPTSDLEVQKHILTPSPVKIEDRTHENPEEALPISNFEGKDSEQAVKSEADDTDSSHGGSILPSCDETLNGFNKTNGDHSALQESPALGNDMNVNLSCSDGSSMALKPESNDSESVVLSRIHTH